jgi:hypothetical protein
MLSEIDAASRVQPAGFDAGFDEIAGIRRMKFS